MCSAALEVLQPIMFQDIQLATNCCKLWVASWLNLDECHFGGCLGLLPKCVSIPFFIWVCKQRSTRASRQQYAQTAMKTHKASSTHLVPENLLKLSCLFSKLTLCVNTWIYTVCQAHFVKYARRQAADYRMCRWIRRGSWPFFDISSTMCVVLTANRWKLLLQQLTCRCQLIKSG